MPPNAQQDEQQNAEARDGHGCQFDGAVESSRGGKCADTNGGTRLKCICDEIEHGDHRPSVKIRGDAIDQAKTAVERQGVGDPTD